MIVEHRALKATPILIRIAIDLQIRRFRSASRATLCGVTVVLWSIGFVAAALGLILQAEDRVRHVLG